MKSSGRLSSSLRGSGSAVAWYEGGAWEKALSSKESRWGAGSYLAFAAMLSMSDCRGCLGDEALEKETGESEAWRRSACDVTDHV